LPEIDTTSGENHPSIVLAVLMILGITIAIIALLVTIEYLTDFNIPGGTISNTVLPAGVVGYLYGRRKEIRFTRAFRLKVIALWYLLSIVASVVVVYFMV
jgi:hypothetical protein